MLQNCLPAHLSHSSMDDRDRAAVRKTAACRAFACCEQHCTLFNGLHIIGSIWYNGNDTPEKIQTQ